MTEQATATQTETSSLSLSLPVEEVKGELVPVPAEELRLDPDLDPELDQLSTQFVEQILSLDLSDSAAQHDRRQSVDGMGIEIQKQSGYRSRMLQEPIKTLAQRGEDGGPVAEALIELKVQTEELNPSHIDFSVSSFAKAFSFIPGVGNKLQKYFLSYESAQGVIDQIIRSLEAGGETLKRDNVTLAEDQKMMRQLTGQLDRQIQLGMAIDRKLTGAADAMESEDSRYRFITEELIFPLRQRIQDMQQQLAVNQQGVLAIEVIIRNNRELMRGVDRAINVTVSALTVAVTVALALANQKIVLDKVNALNRTTSDLIAGTAQKLRTQGVAIHTQASSTMLDMEVLAAAFTDIDQALDEISRYRQEALPKMASQILELDKLTAKSEEAIRRMESGDRAAANVIGVTET